MALAQSLDADMIADSDIAAARARTDVYAEHINLRKAGREHCGLCVFHNEKTPSFYVYPDGHFHCFGCGAHGDPITFVRRLRGLDFAGAVRELNGSPIAPECNRITPPHGKAGADDEAKSENDRRYIARLIGESSPDLARTAAGMYLDMRGLPHSPELRAHPGLWCAEAKREYPALLAPMRDSRGEITAVQRVWCIDRVVYDGSAAPKDNRAPISTRKKTLGSMQDGAVRLAAVDGCAEMGLAEGVETSLACRREFKIRTWAICGLHRLGSPDGRAPAVWIPAHIKSLVIFGDNGEAGHRIADYAAWWYRRNRRVEASVVYPPDKYDDWNSHLIGEIMA